LLPNFVAKALF